MTTRRVSALPVEAVRKAIAKPTVIAVLTRTAIDAVAYVMERLIDIQAASERPAKSA
jgi:hypothetical protein